MRTYDHGASFLVTYDALDAERFAADWPGSTVQGGGGFEWSNSGKLIDSEGSASEYKGDDWTAFREECHVYGLKRIPILRQRKRWAETNRKDGEQSDE